MLSLLTLNHNYGLLKRLEIDRTTRTFWRREVRNVFSTATWVGLELPITLTMSVRSGYCNIEQENVLERGLPDSQNKMKQIVWKYVRFIVITCLLANIRLLHEKRILMLKLNRRSLKNTPNFFVCSYFFTPTFICRLQKFILRIKSGKRKWNKMHTH